MHTRDNQAERSGLSLQPPLMYIRKPITIVCYNPKINFCLSNKAAFDFHDCVIHAVRKFKLYCLERLLLQKRGQSGLHAMSDTF